MSDTFGLMIPGAKVSEKLTVTAPYDSTIIATVDMVDASGVAIALSNGHQIATNRDLWLPIPKRLEILAKTAELMEQQIEELTLEASREGGKPLSDSKVEVVRAIDGVRVCIETLRTQSGDEIPMGLNQASANRIAFTHHEPIGLVVAVSAFNHPLNLIVHQVAPAVAVGCPVIIKPANVTPISCLRFVQLLRQAGLPDEQCQVAVTNNADAEKLVTDSRVNFFSFIGSAKVGWMLRSKLSPGVRCALEHGGAAPAIVTSDADIDAMLPLLTKGGFYHAGQVCVSVQRIFADQSIARDLAEKLGQQVDKLIIGDPTKPETDIGPLIRHGEVDRVESWVNEAIEEGAELITGGKRLSDSTYACTVLYNPSAKSKVSQMEIFGPVVCVYSCTSLNDAIDRANSVPFSFQASIFTKDIDTAMRSYRRLNASAIMINDHTAFRVDWMPFAGLSISGYGIGGIPHTMKDMQIEKMMVLKSDEL